MSTRADELRANLEQVQERIEKACQAAGRSPDEVTLVAITKTFPVSDVRALGGIPILVSSLSRRNYVDGRPDPNDGLADYAAATRQVATEERVTYLDLYGLSTKYLAGLTQEQADGFDMAGHADAKAENGSAAKPDRTHLNEAGKRLFGRMVADNIVRLRVELSPNVVGVAAGSRAALPK